MTGGDPERARTGLWIGLALGVPVMVWGIRGALMESARTHPAELARWIVGGAAVHDAIVLPLVLAVATLARRASSAHAWPFVRWALATTGVVGLVAWPFVRGYGRRPSNPSLLPRDYTAGVVVALSVVWVVTGVLAWRARRRATSDGTDRVSR